MLISRPSLGCGSYREKILLRVKALSAVISTPLRCTLYLPEDIMATIVIMTGEEQGLENRSKCAERIPIMKIMVAMVLQKVKYGMEL